MICSVYPKDLMWLNIIGRCQEFIWMWCKVGYKVDEKEGANTVKGSIQREGNGMSLDPDSVQSFTSLR